MFKKIGLKLIIAVGAITIVMIGIYAIINIKSQSDALTQEVERHANQLSETLKKVLHQDMLLNQRDRIHQIIKNTGEEPYIRDVRILNKEGEIIYSANENDIGKMVDKEAESCYACHAANQPLEKLTINERTRIFKINPDSSNYLGVINPIYNEESCWNSGCHAHSPDKTVLGVLDVSIDLREVDQQIVESEYKVVFFSIITIIVISLVIGVIIKEQVDKPVKELVKATEHVGMGDLNYRIKYNGKDELGSLAVSFNEMTQSLSELRQQVLQSEKLASLGQLAAGVAHEINNPLTGVLTYSSFLLKRAKDDTELQDDLNVIVRETKRCREIVKSLLDFARQTPPNKTKINITDIIDRTLSVVNNELKIHNITLNKNISNGIKEITADSNQLQQMFLNLTVNAIDAIGAGGGEITIKTSRIELPPFGSAQIKNAVCPNNHLLIDFEHKIHGFSSIKVKAKTDSSEGFIYLDPVYGRQSHKYEILLKKNDIIYIYCPKCDVSLNDSSQGCPACSSPVYKIDIPNQGYSEGCVEPVNKWQKWDYIDKIGKRNYLEIVFSDTGCGIPEENIAKIYDPFFTTKGQRGTGLGLSVIWGIVDNHNGTISVKSKTGTGTTFTIRLPEE